MGGMLALMPIGYLLFSKASTYFRITRTIILMFLIASLYFYFYPATIWDTNYVFTLKVFLTIWVLFIERNTLKGLWLKINNGASFDNIAEELAQKKQYLMGRKILTLELYILNKIYQAKRYITYYNRR